MDSPRKVLIVDDEESQRELLSAIFQNRGYETIEACSTKEAKSLLSLVPDVVITDLNMEGLDTGIKTLNAVRDANLDIPVLVRTADSDFIASGDWRGLGFDATAFKGEDNELLVANKVGFLLQGEPRILVIDPSETIRDLLSQMFREVKNCAVRSCSSPSEALREVGEMTFHLITLSNRFELQSGTDVAEMIRRMGIKTPIAMISGSVTAEELPCKNGMIFAKIPKPADKECLRRLLKTL